MSTGEPDIARVAALMGEPTRARVLMALVDGRALSASVLAGEAGVAASTISEHLARLVDAGLLTAERHGRSRYFRLAGPGVARRWRPWRGSPPPSRCVRCARARGRTRCVGPAPVTTTWPGSSVWH